MMGRWSQAKRRGGGISAAVGVRSLDQGTITDDDHSVAALHYTAGSGDVTGLVAANFSAPPGVGTSIAIEEPSQIDVTFPGDLNDGDTVTYGGATPGFKTPDSVVVHSA